MTKKTLFVLTVVFLFAITMGIAMAAQDENNKTTDAPKVAKAARANASTNNTFVACMNDAVTTKQANFDAAKSERKACLDLAAASNTSDAKRAAGKDCSTAYKKTMKEVKSVFRTERAACLKMKHTAWEGFKAYLQ